MVATFDRKKMDKHLEQTLIRSQTQNKQVKKHLMKKKMQPHQNTAAHDNNTNKLLTVFVCKGGGMHCIWNDSPLAPTP